MREALEQIEQIGREDPRVIVYHHHPADAASVQRRRLLDRKQRGQEAVLRAQRGLAMRIAEEGVAAAAVARAVAWCDLQRGQAGRVRPAERHGLAVSLADRLVGDKNAA